MSQTNCSYACLIAALLIGTTADAGTPKRPDLTLNLAPYQMPVAEYCAPSGLRLVFQEDHSRPVVSVTTVIDGGSAADAEGLSGTAHLVEHLWFRSRHDDLPPTMDALEDLGAQLNAFTLEDTTRFSTVAPAAALSALLRVEGRRLEAPLAGITEADLAVQRDVIANERRLRGHGLSYISHYVNPYLFPTSHPYHHHAYESLESINRITLDDASAYAARSYTPANTTVVVVGDLDAAGAWDQVLKTFPSGLLLGDGPTSDAPPVCPARLSEQRRDPPMPTSTALKRVKAPVSTPTLVMSWTLPGGYAETEPMLDASAWILESMAGYFIDRGVRPGRDGDGQASCSVHARPQASVLHCVFPVAEGGSPAKAQQGALRALEELWLPANEAGLAEAMGRYYRYRYSDLLASMGDLTSLALGRSARLADYAHVMGRIDYSAQHSAWLDAMDMDTFRGLARTYLTRDRAVSLLLLPMDETEIAGDADPARYVGHPRQPLSEAALDAARVSTEELTALAAIPRLDEIQDITLDNGLRIVVLPVDAGPITRAALWFNGGYQTTNPGLDQMAWALTNRFYTQGTFDLLEAPTRFLGQWSVGNFGEGKYLGIWGPSGNLDGQIALLRDMVNHLEMPTGNRRTWLQSLEAGFEAIDASESRVLFDAEREAWARLLPGHPLGVRLSTDDFESVSSIPNSELKAWFKQVYQPENATLFIVGHLNAEEARDLASEWFEGWKSGGTTPAAAPPPPAPVDRQILLFDDPGATATVTARCQLKPATATNGEAQSLLAEALDELAFHELRTAMGVSYTPAGSVSRHPGGASIMTLTAAVQPDAAGQAVTALLSLTERAASGELPEGLVDRVRFRQAAGQQVRFASSGQLLTSLHETVTMGYGWETLTGYPQRLAATTAADLSEQAGACAGHEVVTITGPAETVAAQLDAQGLTYERP